MGTIELFMIGAGGLFTIISIIVFGMLSIFCVYYTYKKYNETMNKNFSPLFKIFIDTLLLLIFFGGMYGIFEQIK